MLTSWGGVETFCYWPDEIDVAENQLPFMPVRPTEAVRRFTRLPLTQVLLSTGAGPDLGKSIHRITYVFGSIPGGGRGIPDPAPPEPQFVLVGEQPGHRDLVPRLDRTVYHVGKIGSSEHRTIHGNWTFYAALGSGGGQVVVTGNPGKDVIESIGQAIVGVT